MKILFVIDSMGAGGAERSLAELLPALDGAGITSIIACLDHRTHGIEPPPATARAPARAPEDRCARIAGSDPHDDPRIQSRRSVGVDRFSRNGPDEPGQHAVRTYP
jgi:hypothetical protein